MRRVGIEPDAWIFPSKMAIYASMVPEYLNEYSRGGPKAASALEEGPARFDTFRGNKVFETRPFDTDFMAQGAVEPLVRTRQIGEFYVINSTDQDIEIFDMSRDRFTKVTKDNAKKHFELLGKDHIDHDDHSAFTQYIQARCQAHDITTVGQFNAHANTSPSTLNKQTRKDVIEVLKAAAATDNDINDELTEKEPKLKELLESATIETIGKINAVLRSIVKNDSANLRVEDFSEVDDNALITDLTYAQMMVTLQFAYIIARPRMTYTMASAVLLKGGEELGNTLHGHHDFQLTDDVIHKTHIGHYTFYSKSVVREPKNMYLAEDIYCTGYNGGETTTFMDRSDINNYANHVDHNSKSLIPFAVVPHDVELIGQALAINGSMSELVPQLSTEDSIITEDYAKAYLGENVINIMNQNDNNGETVQVEDDDQQVNAICFRGSERRKNPQTDKYDTTHHNTGHWGPNVYDGCAMVRLGMYAHLKEIKQ